MKLHLIINRQVIRLLLKLYRCEKWNLIKQNKLLPNTLAKKIDGFDTYMPSLLVPVPREDNRAQYNINNDNLPFAGYDVWHAYEFSTLTQNGLPVTRLLKIKYSCESKFIVESKSLKLYLNSFNMHRFGKNIEECLCICKELIKKDLENVLKTDISLEFVDSNTNSVKIFDKFQNILNFVDEKNLIIEKFKESPEVLAAENGTEPKEYYLHFDSLRSNCRVTHQPDFGDAFIYYKSKKHIIEDRLVKYLCSFRSEYHFHEECCEMIYKRLYDLLDIENGGDELFVCALYTRRGGIDICPCRWSKNYEKSRCKQSCWMFPYMLQII